MDRIERMCEEVHAYAGTAERTGTMFELRGLKARQRTCKSVTDLIRKYKLYGDGMFYLPVGQWPDGQAQIDLDTIKWTGISQSFGGR